MDFREYLGREMVSNCGERVFVAFIDPNRGITVKGVDKQDDALCLNKKTFGNYVVNGSFEEHFDFVINIIESGYWPTFEEYVSVFRYKSWFHGLTPTCVGECAS